MRALDELIKESTVVAGSRVDLALSGIGMAVRAGALRPDISSVDALKRTLLQARSIAYSASVSGVYLSTELFQRLGDRRSGDGQEPGDRRRAGRRRGGARRSRGRRPPSTGLFESTDTKLGEESELFRDLEG